MNNCIYPALQRKLKYPQTTYGAFGSRLLHVRDAKAANTDGGTFTSGAWQTRALNTTNTNEITGASVASNRITVPPGTYYVKTRAPAYAVDSHQSRLRNTTLGTTILVGSNAVSSNASNGQCDTVIEGRFTVDRITVLELQHRATTTQATNGFGAKNNFGELEIYSEVWLWKLT